ncbi:hypothetical protein ACM66B_005625 [Microbotryomycetes sp. NB124-2]
MHQLPLEVRLRIVYWVELVDRRNWHCEDDEGPLYNVRRLALVNKDWNFACRSALFRRLRLSRTRGDLEFFTPELAAQVGTHVRSLSCEFGEDTAGNTTSKNLQSLAMRGQCAFSAVLPYCDKVEELALEVGMFDDTEASTTFMRPLATAADVLATTLQRLSVVSMYMGEPTVSIDPRPLARRLRPFKHLTNLSIVGVGRGSAVDEEYFVKTLAQMSTLEKLSLSDCDCLGPRMTYETWSCPLRSLSIKRCNRIDLVDVEEMTTQLATTLRDLTIHHFAPLDDESIARFAHLRHLDTLELESVYPVLHLRCFIPCNKTLRHVKLGIAIRPWNDEDGEGQIFRSVLECLRPGLRKFELMQGFETWGQDVGRDVEQWCRRRGVEFEVGEDEPFSEFEEDEEDEYMSEGM